MEQPLQLSGGPNNTGSHNRYNIEDRSYISLIKKDTSQAAMEMGFSAERVGKLGIILSELVSNLLKFGKGNGELLWKRMTIYGEDGLEILAIDKGYGISNVNQALKDGFSTSGTAGEGLGAIQRLSDFFEIYSQPDVGTVVLARLSKKEKSHFFNKPLQINSISVPKPGEKLCGDANMIFYDAFQKVFKVFLIDGLGHGSEAYDAAQKALDVYKELKDDQPHEILQQIHEAIKDTRGGVAMALNYDFEEHKLNFCGIGNINGRLMGIETSSGLFSLNGIVGHVFPSEIDTHQIEWEVRKILILSSDGITSRYNLNKYLHIQKHDPAIIAACLYRDFKRGNDDASIIVSKYPSTHE